MGLFTKHLKFVSIQTAPPLTTHLDLLRREIGNDSRNSISPVMKWLNPTLLKINEQGLTYGYVVRHEMTNPSGNLHGGISALIIDDTIGATLIAFLEDYFCVTVNNNIDYKAAAGLGETILAETVITDSASRIVTVQCEIWNADRSKLIARGVSRMLKKANPRSMEGHQIT